MSGTPTGGCRPECKPHPAVSNIAINEIPIGDGGLAQGLGGVRLPVAFALDLEEVVEWDAEAVEQFLSGLGAEG